MSFNIQTNATRFQVAPWTKRAASISELIAEGQYPIVGVQEALKPMLTDLLASLPAYGYVGHGRDDGQDKGEHAAILYDRTKLKVKRTQTLWLSQTPDKPGTVGWDATCPRIVTWAHFEDLLTKNHFFAFNTHFDHVGRVAQANSARLLAAEFLRITQGAPGIVMGDFNVSDRNATYHLFIEESGLSDACAKAQHSGPKYTHSFYGIYKSRIDYIFVSPGIQVQRNETLPEKSGSRLRRSDHLPIVSDLGFL